MALLFCSACTFAAPSGAATDAAFAALLAIPGAQPREGGWIIPPQDKPTPRNETELIQRLQAMQKAGAQFNAMRHQGTLLAHAIRAGKDQTAIWLLRQGAKTSDVAFGGLTAHQLALKYQRTAVSKVLEERYGFKVAPPMAGLAVNPSKTPATSELQTAPALSPREQARRLLGQQNTHFSNKADQQTWQTLSAQLTAADHAALFSDGVLLPPLLSLMHETVGGVEAALSRLPQELVQTHAQVVADFLARASFISYANGGKRAYNAVARSWPALWRRIKRPLDYGKRPDLAEHVPPELWPELFASGYQQHRADATGCLLSAVDATTFRTIWPVFERHFTDARELGPELVLKTFLLSRESHFCYPSTSEDTVEKLRFLKAKGMPGTVTGLRKSVISELNHAQLTAAVAGFTRQPMAPRLSRAPLECQLVLGDDWLDALAKLDLYQGYFPAGHVQAIDMPGQTHCALIVGGSDYGDRYEAIDDFGDGPMGQGWGSCPERPGSSEIWYEAAATIRKVAEGSDPCEGGCTLRKVRDAATGKPYWLNDGLRGPTCAESAELPDAFEWRTGSQGMTFALSPDAGLLERLLREQCVEGTAEPGYRSLPPVCKGLDDAEPDEAAIPISAMKALKEGGLIGISALLRELGAERRHAYAAAIAAHDRVRIRELAKRGIPGEWTDEEIRLLAKAPLPLKEKRHRVALLFADPVQLGRAINGNRYDTPESLLKWLPDQDWGPVLRAIGRDPDVWRDSAKGLRTKAEEAGRSAKLICGIDHALGQLCGGGIVPH